jgi:hypothetical protein
MQPAVKTGSLNFNETDSPQLQLQLSLKNLVIFQFFFFLMHELHEQAHIITGRILCGGWATRDFNVWKLCDSCSLLYSVAATFVGPIFTFAMLWLGRYWLKYGRSFETRSLGFVFIFGNMPFGRIYMAALRPRTMIYIFGNCKPVARGTAQRYGRPNQ